MLKCSASERPGGFTPSLQTHCAPRMQSCATTASHACTAAVSGRCFPAISLIRHMNCICCRTTTYCPLPVAHSHMCVQTQPMSSTLTRSSILSLAVSPLVALLLSPRRSNTPAAKPPGPRPSSRKLVCDPALSRACQKRRWRCVMEMACSSLHSTPQHDRCCFEGLESNEWSVVHALSAFFKAFRIHFSCCCSVWDCILQGS